MFHLNVWTITDETGKLQVLYWNAITIVALLCLFKTGYCTLLISWLNLVYNEQWWQGGSGHPLNNKLKHELLPSSDNSLLELIGIKVLNGASPITFYAVYLPGSASYQDISSFYVSDAKYVQHVGYSFPLRWFQLKTSFVELWKFKSGWQNPLWWAQLNQFSYPPSSEAYLLPNVG
jgi:hypothetical protein